MAVWYSMEIYRRRILPTVQVSDVSSFYKYFIWALQNAKAALILVLYEGSDNDRENKKNVKTKIKKIYYFLVLSSSIHRCYNYTLTRKKNKLESLRINKVI